MREVAVLIPAYRPDARLNALIGALRRRGFGRVVVVDDGSGARYAPVFNEAWLQGARVLYHEANRGVGAALKTGLNWLNLTGAMMVVTCAADGRHAAEDIEMVAQALLGAPDALVLGARDVRELPVRRRLRCVLARVLLRLRGGPWLRDAQAGLRGLPARLLPGLLRVTGERDEYAANALLYASCHAPVVEVPIATIQVDRSAYVRFRARSTG